MNLLKRLKLACKILLNKAHDIEILPGNDLLLQAENEAASARIEADEAEKRINALSRELDAERHARNDVIDSTIAARLEPMFKEAAAIFSQLALQDFLIQSEKKVNASDVMAVARQIFHLFERFGLQPGEKPGTTCLFDPEKHQALDNSSINQGSPVTIRLPAFSLNEKIIRKAMVEKIK
ncbi:nucleotide exchange factor GrpE [Candidatus Sumerlaeota bacterium]|nr:nucleotide exchange factor GrpE [Candidatus Sumerlaeota bacterium]